MTTEAAPTTTNETTTSPAAAPPTSERGKAFADAVAAADEILGGGAGDTSTPASLPLASPSEDPPADATPAVETLDLPRLAEVEQLAKQRREAAEAREREQAIPRQLQALQQQLEQLASSVIHPGLLADPDKAEQALAQAGVDVDAFVAGLARKRLAAKGQQPPTAGIEAKLEALAAKLEALTAPPAPAKTVPPSEAEIEQLKSVFSEYTAGAGDLYPRLSALPAAMVGTLGWDYVARLAKSGHDVSKVTDAQIAAAIERELGPATPPANGGTPVPGHASTTPNQATNGGTTPSAPRSISPGLAAEGAAAPPRSKREIYEDLVAFTRTLQS